MKKLRSVLYLDEYKLYSLYSQLFDGFTEDFVSVEGESTEHFEEKELTNFDKVEKQKNAQEKSTYKKKVLLDFSLSQFEQELSKLGLLRNIEKEKDFLGVEDYTFVRIKSSAMINDVKIIENTLKEFNKLGQSLSCIMEQYKDEVSSKKSNHKKINPTKLAKENDLYIEPDLINNLLYILRYGFHENLELRMEFEDQNNENLVICNSILKRECLREDERILIRKYSRRTELPFIVFGIVTQPLNNDCNVSKNLEEKIHKIQKDSSNTDYWTNVAAPKEAIFHLVNSLILAENHFIGKGSNEVIIDPISVYIELNH